MTTAAAPTCPFCGASSRHAFWARDRNREVSQEQFEYARCPSCKTVFLVDPPDDLGRYYEDDYYQFDVDGEPEWKRDKIRLSSASFRVGMLSRQIQPGHLIEIGAGTGAFAVTAKGAGFDVTAIEMDAGCCSYLSEREGIRALCTDQPLEALTSLPPARAIAIWHVLEHLPNPADVLDRAAEKLEPGGVLALGVPNPASLQFRLLGSRWAHLDAPRHLNLIPPDALLERAASLGLGCVAMTTTDPEGLECNQFGWAYALRRRPADPLPRYASHLGLVLALAAAPIERTGLRGTSVMLVLRKQP